MANIMDYLDWRGDLTFQQAPFNEVDNLIFAQLVYVQLDGIVPGITQEERIQSITLDKASEEFFKTHTEEEILNRVSMTKRAAFVMRKMAETRRFSKVKLSCYQNEISLEEESQFSVMTIEYEENAYYIAFSGTDETIVGWKENFNMSFLNETPGQLKAVKYLNTITEFTEGTLRIGGHSKGGNLSIYGAIHCNPKVQERILQVYSNDGPGFTPEMMEKTDYTQMLPRILTIMPESSIVGMLFEHEEKYEVVKSSVTGPSQHDAMSWEVLGAQFVRAKALAENSIMLDKTLKAWIRKMDKEQREEFVEVVFGILEKADVRTVDDLASLSWKNFSELIKMKNALPKEKQEVLTSTLQLLWEEGNHTIRKVVQRKVGKKDVKK